MTDQSQPTRSTSAQMGQGGACDYHLLDRVYLTELQGHIGSDFTIEILSDGIISLSDRLDRLRQMPFSDLSGIANLAHTVTGVAGQIGLHTLSATVRALEHAAIRHERDKIEPLLAKASDHGAASLDQLGRWAADLRLQGTDQKSA